MELENLRDALAPAFAEHGWTKDLDQIVEGLLALRAQAAPDAPVNQLAIRPGWYHVGSLSARLRVRRDRLQILLTATPYRTGPAVTLDLPVSDAEQEITVRPRRHVLAPKLFSSDALGGAAPLAVIPALLIAREALPPLSMPDRVALLVAVVPLAAIIAMLAVVARVYGKRPNAWRTLYWTGLTACLVSGTALGATALEPRLPATSAQISAVFAGFLLAGAVQIAAHRPPARRPRN